MAIDNLPNVGDVVVSPKFAYGYYRDIAKERLTVDGKTTRRLVERMLTEDERVAMAAATGEIPDRKETVDLSAYDPSRATAKFVIESARMEGGDKDALYPDGWHVSARHLNEDGSYDPRGEVIHFYMSGDREDVIGAADISVIGKMQMTFVWI